MQATTAIQRLEGGAIAAVSVIAFVQLGYQWWWLLALFLIFDLSIGGYVFGPRTGAWTYNLVHAFVGPVLVGGWAFATGDGWAMFLAPLWLFHTGIDRVLGYGLKEPDSFGHTHLSPHS